MQRRWLAPSPTIADVGLPVSSSVGHKVEAKPIPVLINPQNFR